ncbi:SGNH hydrolase-type esterase domain [Dillenia turbinata]|uniref:SGNH hydrolase-type esterase domain n=1 Tax=Dillenia turbinata TaxID=194707 RepID=A0AAN8ZQK5_9MAGN
MVGPERPQFVLFGSSIVQCSYAKEGWAAILADLYARKADIILRGYAGWNSRHALQVLEQVFPKNATAVQPALVIVYFGGNDSMLPHPSGLGRHVPLEEYVENMRKIAIHLKFWKFSNIYFLETSGTFGPMGRKNENCRIYSEACLKLCREQDVKVIDLWTAIQKHDDWLNTCFTDGIHLSPEGSKIVAKEILKVLRDAEWEPSLCWKSLPTEFAGPPFDIIDPDSNVNLSDMTTYSEIELD